MLTALWHLAQGLSWVFANKQRKRKRGGKRKNELPWLAWGNHGTITISQYWFTKTKQHTRPEKSDTGPGVSVSSPVLGVLPLRFYIEFWTHLYPLEPTPLTAPPLAAPPFAAAFLVTFPASLSIHSIHARWHEWFGSPFGEKSRVEFNRWILRWDNTIATSQRARWRCSVIFGSKRFRTLHEHWIVNNSTKHSPPSKCRRCRCRSGWCSCRRPVRLGTLRYAFRCGFIYWDRENWGRGCSNRGIDLG